MEVRFKFSADLVISGDSIAEIKEKWESMPLFSQDAEKCGVEYCATELIEDAETYEDLVDSFY